MIVAVVLAARLSVSINHNCIAIFLLLAELKAMNISFFLIVRNAVFIKMAMLIITFKSKQIYARKYGKDDYFSKHSSTLAWKEEN